MRKIKEFIMGKLNYIVLIGMLTAYIIDSRILKIDALVTVFMSCVIMLVAFACYISKVIDYLKENKR